MSQVACVPSREEGRIFRPSVRILESNDSLELVAEVPGADETTTEVVLEDDTLTVRAKTASATPEGAKLVYNEFPDGVYMRTFRVSDGIDRQKIQARVKDGILRVTLPKSTEAQTKKINVLAG